MPLTGLDMETISRLDKALMDAAIVQAEKATAASDTSRALRHAQAAATLAHAVKGTVGGGALATTGA